MSEQRRDPHLLTASLKENQLPQEDLDWYCSYLRAYDRCDLESYRAFLAPDCQMRGNSGEPLVGKHIILEAVPHFWSAYRWGAHELLNVVGSPRMFAAEAVNHYECHDGWLVKINASAFTVRDSSGLITSIHFYGDTAALG